MWTPFWALRRLLLTSDSVDTGLPTTTRACSPPVSLASSSDRRCAIRRRAWALDSGDCGKILWAKGIVNGEGGQWIEFDFVPEEHEVRAGHPYYTGRLCVIGAELKEDKLSQLFGL